MTMHHKRIMADDETFVEGRTRETAVRLISKAAELGVDPKRVKATTGGYVAPKSLVDGQPTAGGTTSGADTGHFSSVEENNTNLPHPDSKEDEKRKGEADEQNEFDPAEHDVKDVKKYLEDVNEEERQRVLDAEREGKARKSLLLDNEREED